MLFHKTCPSLFTVSDELDGNGLPGTAITLYQPSDDSDIRELEKLGIKFVPKVVKDGEFQDTYDRDRRAKS